MGDEVYYDMKEGLIFRLMEIKGVDHLPWVTSNAVKLEKKGYKMH